MKLLIIRHADPDYEKDSLTPKGFREAAHLAERLGKQEIKACYVSTLGRAKETAAPTLKKLSLSATACEWLKEFPTRIDKPNIKDSIAWDWLPKDWTNNHDYYCIDTWLNGEPMIAGNVCAEYERVTKAFDGVLASHGYIRDGRLYRAECANNDTIAFFCHFGSGCVLLSHLLGISPMLLWHGFCAAPSSVTTVVTEERRKGTAYFRVLGFGDTSHLYAKDEPPAFAARFRETYFNEHERKD